ncbi:MAG: deoxyguanosinetriphosphate triphosphohydrolase [Synergistaceae bacterium]
MNTRVRWEEIEKHILSPFAALSSESKGRAKKEEPCSVRTCFQRDRDRIIHSKSFRRLKYKTQVLLLPEGDHYRTRLTHTLEVSQIARTIARALMLNEDLTEAVALGHDLGHTPFGHMGEKVLDSLAKDHGLGGFHHAVQSLRVVDCLEKDGRGLNLTWEVRMGIIQHSKGQVDVHSGFDLTEPSTLEAWVVRISDSVAYLNHDLDDALRAQIVGFSDIPGSVVDKMGTTHAERINSLIMDIIENSIDSKPTFSPSMLMSIETLRGFLYSSVYRHANAQIEDSRVEHVLTALFKYRMEKCKDNPQGAVDFISGMTDRFALQLFQDIYVPSPWPKSRIQCGKEFI